jgi:hypothetical protein
MRSVLIATAILALTATGASAQERVVMQGPGANFPVPRAGMAARRLSGAARTGARRAPRPAAATAAVERPGRSAATRATRPVALGQ